MEDQISEGHLQHPESKLPVLSGQHDSVTHVTEVCCGLSGVCGDTMGCSRWKEFTWSWQWSHLPLRAARAWRGTQGALCCCLPELRGEPTGAH